MTESFEAEEAHVSGVLGKREGMFGMFEYEEDAANLGWLNET